MGVPGAAVAVVRDGEVVYLKGHGVREAGGDRSVTPDTVFPLASCTKAFTTTILAMLVDEGKMSWDDPVRKHLDWFHLSDPLADRDVTLRDLVTHRTGLRRPRHALVSLARKAGRNRPAPCLAAARPPFPHDLPVPEHHVHRSGSGRRLGGEVHLGRPRSHAHCSSSWR